MNISNKLTLFRVLLIPFFLFFLLTDFDLGAFTIFSFKMEINLLLALLIFAVASVTDWLDGYLARKYNFVTDFGKFMDPLADKILVMAAFIGMVELQYIPAWAAILILTRELAVTGLRLIISGSGQVLAAQWLGKVKTATQMGTIILFLLFPLSLVSDIGLYITVLITLYSGWDYFKSYTHLLNPNK